MGIAGTGGVPCGALLVPAPAPAPAPEAATPGSTLVAVADDTAGDRGRTEYTSTCVAPFAWRRPSDRTAPTRSSNCKRATVCCKHRNGVYSSDRSPPSSASRNANARASSAAVMPSDLARMLSRRRR